MKKVLITSLIAVGLFSQNVFAAEETADRFTGRIGVGGIFIDSANNLNPGSSAKQIDSLDAAAEKDSSFVIALLPELNWDVGMQDGVKLYLTTDPPIDEVGGFVINTGGTLQTAAGIFDASVFAAPFGEVWQNPYLTGTNREETDNPKYGVKLALNRIGGTGLRANIVYVIDDIDNDLIGTSTPTLDRNGAVYALNVNYSIYRDKNLEIRPRLSIRRGEYDGEANSFMKYKADLEARYRTGKLMVIPRVHYSYSDYDEVNPLFNKTRNNKAYGFSIITSYMAPFNMENWSATALLSLSKGESNIEFYDTESFSLGALVNYHF